MNGVFGQNVKVCSLIDEDASSRIKGWLTDEGNSLI